MSRRHKEPTAVRLMEEALRTADDFMNMRMLMERTGQPLNRVTTSESTIAQM